MVRVCPATLLVLIAPAIASDDWANFWDDSNCSVNEGIGVDMTNEGCLNEPGRGSFSATGNGESFGICTYNHPNCEGGSDGKAYFFQVYDDCIGLETPCGYSYRFIPDGSSCP